MRRALLLLALTTALVAGTASGASSAPLPGGDGPGGTGDDTTAPVITINRPPGSVQGWHKEPVRISMTVSDSHPGATGVSRASFKLSGATTGSGVFVENRAEVMISNEGSTRIEVEAWDRADNLGEHAEAVGVDTTAPVITLETAVSGQTFARGQKVPVSYQCVDAGVGLDSCTAPVASGADLPTHQLGQFAFQISTRDRLGNARLHQVSYTVVEPYFAVVENPRVVGTVKVGEQVRASAPTFSPQPDRVDYQWWVDGVSVAGATDQAYTVRPQDVDKALTVTATAHKTGFQAQSAQSPWQRVQAGTLTMAGSPTVTGQARVGGELTLSHPAVSPASAKIEYRWMRNSQVIPGATGRTYRPQAADLGQEIWADVVVTAPGYHGREWQTVAVGPVTDGGPVPVSGATTVSGTARVASVLTARPSSFGPGSTVRYQWLRNGAAIKGATARTYRLQPADRGKRVSVRVTGSRAGYTSSVRTSPATKAVVKATPTVKASAKARGKRKVRLTVTVASTGVTPTGKVTVKRGSKVVARGKTLRSGKVTVNLSRQKRGRGTYTVTYTGSTGFNAKSVKTRTVRVR